MDTKHNINYFRKKDVIKTVGVICLALGAVGILLAYSTYIGYLLAMVLLPVGLVTFIVGTSIVSSESDIDEDIRKATADTQRDIASEKTYAKRILKNIPQITAEGYDYEEGLMLRKAKNSSIRSSQYTKAVIHPLTDALVILACTVSLVSTETKSEFVEIPYTEINSLGIIKEEKELSFGKDSFKVKSVRLVIKHSDGLIFSAPFADTMSSEDLVTKLNKLISDAKRAE